jgi:hypothetical protein
MRTLLLAYTMPTMFDLGLMSVVMYMMFLAATAAWAWIFTHWLRWPVLVVILGSLLFGWATMMGLAWFLSKLDRGMRRKQTMYCLQCGSVLPPSGSDGCPNCGCRGGTKKPIA